MYCMAHCSCRPDATCQLLHCKPAMWRLWIVGVTRIKFTSCSMVNVSIRSWRQQVYTVDIHFTFPFTRTFTCTLYITVGIFRFLLLWRPNSVHIVRVYTVLCTRIISWVSAKRNTSTKWQSEPRKNCQGVILSAREGNAASPVFLTCY